ncbi:MAG TPA: carbonic anhydrase [Kineosporiaceae bacterium]
MGGEQRAMTPAAAWRSLREGNERFVTGRREHPHQDADRRSRLTAGQNPFAVVFGCSDSRVAAEIIFDRGLGDLFVVRTAGHVVDTGVLGSLEFGVSVLGTPLVVVLGHDRCGAVVATLRAHLSGELPGGFVRDIVERVSPSLITAGRDGHGSADPPGWELALHDTAALDGLIEAHVRHTCAFLLERSRVLADAVRAGTCAVAGMTYHLNEGITRPVNVLGDVDDPDHPGARVL